MIGKSSTKWFHVLIFASLLFSLAAPASFAGATGLTAQRPDGASNLLQFTSQGHVLGFAADGYYAISGTHALRVEFAGANPVQPASLGAASRGSQAAPLTRVTYADLWDGISLAFDAPSGGILQTTYTLQPGADPARIRLGYNALLEISADGKLVARYRNGQITESAPVAWQQIDGQRVDVAVRFETRGRREVGFALGAYDPAYTLMIDPITIWNTFLGGSGGEAGNDIALDASGNIYVVGDSDADWGGTPVRAYTAAGYDAFVAKLDPSGALLWHTFLGGSLDDYGNGIALDGSGNIYVTGWSDANVSGAWSCPVDCTVTSLNDVDAFVAKLDNDGNLLWNTFTGGTGNEIGTDIAVDASGNSFVTGYSDGTWGAPLIAFTASVNDAYAARFNASGTRIWNTFIGGSGDDQGNGIALDSNGDVFVTGLSSTSWGISPRRVYTALDDGFYAKLSPANGARAWHGFLGGSGNDSGAAVTADSSGNLYVAGTSSAAWGTPVDAYTGGDDGFAAQIDIAAGTLNWNTFQGSATLDSNASIVEDGLGNVFVMGTSDAQWGTPVQGHSGGTDTFLARLDLSGNRAMHAFLGGAGNDTGGAIAAVSSGDVFMLGDSGVEWGTPIRPHNNSGNNVDAFVAEVDIVSPSALSFALQNPASSLTNADSLTFRVTFNEDVLGVNSADFLKNSASTASVTGAVSVGGSARVYDVTLSGGNLATFNGTVGLNLNPASDITDIHGNALVIAEPATDEIYTLDNVVPTVTVNQAGGQADPTNDTAINFTAVFSEAINPASFTAGDVTLGGTIGGTSATVTEIAPFDGTTFDITVSGMSGAGSVTASLGSGVVQDPAGNGNTASTSGDNEVTYDGIAPTIASFVRQSPAANPTNADALTFRATFSEDVTGVDAADFAANGSTAIVSAVTPVSASVYDVTLSGGDLAGFDGPVGLDSAASPALTDLVGNAFISAEPATDETFTVDNTAPTATAFSLQTPATSPTNADTLVFRAAFDEDVTGVDAADFGVNGTTTATVSAVTPVSASLYDVTVSGGDLAGFNGVVGLDFVGPTITDLAGNVFAGAEPATDETYTLDNTAPDASIDPPTPPDPSASADATFNVSSTDGTATFECDMDGLGFAACTSPWAYLGLGDGTHTFSVRAIDAVGNVGTPASFTWLVDTASPAVVSSLRLDANPTSKRFVNFTVTFTEPVSGVDATDFSFTKTGAITGYAVTNVTNAGAVYTVTVNTGTGNGSLRLDVLNDGTILDAANNPLTAGFTTGEAYTVQKVLTLKSAGASDGWVLESSETSNAGGTFNAGAGTFRLGDDAARKQYRSLLSFVTSGLPDNAVITKVTLRIKKQGITGGGNPFTLFQGLFVDVRKGFFGTGAGLAAQDFQAPRNKTVGPSTPAPAANWYSLDLTSAKGFINKLTSASGVTQFRLRFKLDDNNNALANYISFYSGNAPAASRPQLIIEYYVP